MKPCLLCAFTLTLAACATTPPPEPAAPTPPPAAAQQAQPAAFDPVGIYDFTTEVQGTSVRGTLTLRRGEQGLTGAVNTELTGELPLQQVTMEGRRGEFRASTSEGAMLMRVEFVEDRITGGWELSSGMSGTVAGTRRRQ